VEKKKPVICIFGNDRYTGAVPESVSFLEERFPQLMQFANKAHLSGSRVVVQDYSKAGSPIMEATPARYSDFIICGQLDTPDLQSISSGLIWQSLKVLGIIAFLGLLLAFLSALYFTVPIRRLILATEEIIRGNYSIRLNTGHPDEFAVAASAFNQMAAGLEEGRLLSSFVSASVNELTESEDILPASTAEIRQVSVLFSSIRGFHHLHSECLPEELFRYLQAHLSVAVSAINDYGGEIDKMIEDKLMIVFSSNDARKNAMAAAATAVRIREEMQRLNLQTAAGINSGEAISGIMGATSVRLAKTVIGDTINLAARLASVASDQADGGIVISGATAGLLPDSYKCYKLPISRVKGKTHEVEAYLVNRKD
jgi:class 3 adenylate cyclase